MPPSPRPRSTTASARGRRRRHRMRPMTLCRRHRVLAALCAAFALVYAQLVFSGYACSFGDEMEASAMCQMHCDYDSQSLDLAKPLPQLPQALPPALRLVVLDAAVAPSRLVGA